MWYKWEPVIIDSTVAPIADAYCLVTNSKRRYQSLIEAKTDDAFDETGCRWQHMSVLLHLNLRTICHKHLMQ